MSGIAAAIGGGAVLGSIMQNNSSKRAARAAGDAAVAEGAEAREVRSDIYKYGTQAMAEQNFLARATPQELRAITEQYQTSMRQLESDEKLLASVDPALMEASQQALKLLRGEKAASLGPLEDQRKQQREALVNSLREQYGGSAESSSVGMKALRQFDSETANILNGAQQSSLGMMLGTAGGARPNLTNNVNSLGATIGNMGNLQQRQLGASQTGWGQLMANYSGTSGAVINSAGAQYTTQALTGQANANMWGNIANQGANIGGLAMGSYFAGKFNPASNAPKTF